MTKKLTGRALAKFESERDIWQEVLAGVEEIKAGGGKLISGTPMRQFLPASKNACRAPKSVQLSRKS